MQYSLGILYDCVMCQTKKKTKPSTIIHPHLSSPSPSSLIIYRHGFLSKLYARFIKCLFHIALGSKVAPEVKLGINRWVMYSE